MQIKIIGFILILFISVIFILFKSNRGGINMIEVNTDDNVHKILVAYFSKAGEQYSVGNIIEGNTAIVAKIIADKLKGDLFEIKVKNDNYPKDYTKLTEYAKSEMVQNVRPEIEGKIENFADYDVIFLGYPVWWGDKPMPVYTFLESYNFNGKTIIPFATHEGSGFTGIQNMDKTGAKVLKGLGIYGHVAQNNKVETEKQVSEWLKGLGF